MQFCSHILDTILDKQNFLKKSILVLITACLTNAAISVELNGLFTDNMVLQMNQPVRVYGTAIEGESITVSINGQEHSTITKDGQWQVSLAPLEAGGPYEMLVSGNNSIELKNILVGEVWVLGGQSNMARRFSTYQWLMERLPELEENDQVRMFKIKENTIADEPSKQIVMDSPYNDSWQSCSHELIEGFSPLGYFFAIKRQQRTGRPIGVIMAARGATRAECWVPMTVLESKPEFAEILDPAINSNFGMLKDDEPNVNHPSALYNGTIHPLIPFTIKGVLWNQGESDSRYYQRYRTLFPELIRYWRKAWGQGDFPFVFGQLSSNKDRTWSIIHEPKESSWAWQREAQECALDEPNTAMAVAYDIGEWEDIHPQDKETLAGRYELAVENLDGGDVISEGPRYKSNQVIGREMHLSFSNLHGGLATRRVVMNRNRGLAPGTDPEAFIAPAAELHGFTMCGPDHVFHEAEARIEGDKVVVSSEEVSNPVAVRYAWATFALANLYNKAGLPAYPFRTDDLPDPQVSRDSGRQ